MMYVKGQMIKEAVKMYNQVGQWERAHGLASKYMDPKEVKNMYIKQANELEDAEKYREAEKLYLSVNEADLAIAMYKRAEQYDSMVSVVSSCSVGFNSKLFLLTPNRIKHRTSFRHLEQFMPRQLIAQKTTETKSNFPAQIATIISN